MKGLVFTEFLEMVEKEFGYEMVDKLLNEHELPSGGVYTAVGTYDHAEMVTLVTGLSHSTQIAVPGLLNAFGRYLFGTFLTNYPTFFEKAPSAFDFLRSIEDYIHVEVKKLYPEAELPRFETQELTPGTLEMVYISNRKMSDLAEGLIVSALEHYQEKVTLQKETLEADGSRVKFTITKQS